ncbi:hypothetical protein CDAR_463311 [Caerostris darwini]|uniref:Uncharacterized protein n=1 Tax=Caerostris darwini TaxID=1538125 RepID=A0AAV4UXE1_9ARAC|nr:hypothetical protein CDAR_463311 [Caerostris darwini]
MWHGLAEASCSAANAHFESWPAMAQTTAQAMGWFYLLFHPPVFLHPDNRQNVIHKRTTITATSEERDSGTGEVSETVPLAVIVFLLSAII